MLEVARAMERCGADDMAGLRARLQNWEFTRPAQPATLDNTIRLCWALQRKIRERGYRDCRSRMWTV